MIKDGQARVPSSLGITSLSLCGASQCVALSVTQDDNIDQVLVSPTTLAQVTDSASIREIYVKLTDDADATEVLQTAASGFALGEAARQIAAQNNIEVTTAAKQSAVTVSPASS